MAGSGLDVGWELVLVLGLAGVGAWLGLQMGLVLLHSYHLRQHMQYALTELVLGPMIS